MPKPTSAAEPAGASLTTSTALVGEGAAVWSTSPGRSASAPQAAAVTTKVVLVTMDSHLASAAQRAGRTLARQLPGVVLSVHAADEWGSDDTALARCKADIAQGDIIIVTMLFMEDHFLPLLPTLQARRPQCDAMVCAMSATEVSKLTRMGKFDMSAPASGMVSLLKRLRGKAKETADNKADNSAPIHDGTHPAPDG